jgi:protocatechuate 3,4-dioxygenase beta subunit
MRRFAFVLVVACSAPLHAAIRGAVFSANGAAVEKARVSVYRRETVIEWRERNLAGREREAIGSATTNAEGSFAIDTKVQGVVDITVLRDGYAPKLDSVLVDDNELVIELTSAAMRNGRVTAGGKPVADALVLVETERGIAWSARSDEKGSFAIPDPSKWTRVVEVLHPDYATLVADVSRNASLELKLVPGTSVRGRVLGSDRAPVAKAKLFANAWPVGTTNDDGTFVIAHAGDDVKSIEAFTPSEVGSAKRAAEIEIKLEPSHTITGTVRDARERPLPGARVHALPSTPPMSQGAVRVAIADDNGNYRIDGCGAEQYNVAADAASLSFESAVASLRGSRAARADFTAIASNFLTGIVVDQRKHPIAGAHLRVTMAQVPLMYAFAKGAEIAGTKSGRDGRFRIELPRESMELGRQMPMRLQAIHRQYAAGSADIKTDGKQSPVTIMLYDGIEVRGTVKDKDGNAISGADVAVVQNPFGAVAFPLDMLLASGRREPFIESDSEGKFTLHLNEALHDLGVWKEGFAGFRLGGLTPVKGQKPIEVVLEPGVEIRGRVVAKKAMPVDGSVTVEGERRWSQSDATVAPDGTFVIPSLTPGMYSLQYTSSSVRNLTQKKEVKAPASDVVIELPAMGELRGRVTDEATNRPVPRFDVQAMLVTAEMATMESYEDTDTFTFPIGLGPATVTIRAPGYLTETQQVTIGEEKPASVTFALTRGRAISGRVTTEHGLPVAHARVWVRADDDNQSPNAESGQDGEFEIAGAPREPVTLDAVAEGFVSKSLDVDGDTDRHVNIVLSAGRKISGRVVTSSGEPVEGAMVWASSADGSYEDAHTSADGTFTMAGFPDARLSFHATRSDLGEAKLDDVDPASTSIVITFPPGKGAGAIHGTVKGFSERAWTYGSVSAEGAQTTIQRDGTYRLENIHAGEVEVRAFAFTSRDQVSTPPVKVTVIANDDLEVNLAFRTDIVLRGTVTEGGQPSAGRPVMFASEQGMWRTRTNENGLYEITGIEPGLYQVNVETSQRQEYTTRYQLTASATFDIAIAFTQIHGRVVDEEGAPQPGTAIEVSEKSTATDANGAFTINVNEADSYVVTATKKGFATAVQKIADARTPIVFTLVRSGGLRVRLTDARDGKTLAGYIVATNDAGLIAARANEQEKDGSFNVPLPPGAYRVSVSANGYASQSIRITVPFNGELRLSLTPGGNLIVRTDKPSNDLVKLVMPTGEDYVRCECNGIAEIRLTGTTTTIDHIAPGRYTMQVLDAQRRIKAAYPVAIEEGQTTTAEVHVPE